MLLDSETLHSDRPFDLGCPETCPVLQATVNPVYIPSLKQQASESTLVQDELENAVFGGEEGLAGALGGDPRECAILMSGLPGSVVAAITRRLTLEGVTRERILFCDFM